MPSNTLNKEKISSHIYTDKREANIELLRIVLMIMIISYHFFSFYIQGTYSSNQSLFFTKLLFTSATAMAVDCFVFISGFYGLKFKLKQVVSLTLQAIFYSYICFAILVFTKPDLININFFFKYLFPISSSVWWFITTYILLYFLAPFLNSGIKILSKTQFQILLVGFLFLNCFSNFFFDLEMAGHLVNFIFIYLLARFMNIYKITVRHSLILYILIVILTFFVNMVMSIQLEKAALTASRYSSIFCILSATCLFFTFKRINIKSNIVLKIAPLCLGVYLFHFNYYIWNMVIANYLFWIGDHFEYNLSLFTIFNVLLAVVVFFAGICFEKLRQIICKPLLNYIGNKIDKLNLNI